MPRPKASAIAKKSRFALVKAIRERQASVKSYAPPCLSEDREIIGLRFALGHSSITTLPDPPQKLPRVHRPPFAAVLLDHLDAIDELGARVGMEEIEGVAEGGRGAVVG